MSKIPQGEWNAIAARYESGEFISKIARSYGCTPPAIHYILKRNGQRSTATLSPPMPTYPMETPQTRLVRANAAGTVPAVSAMREKVIDEAGSSGVLRARSPAPGFTTQDIAKPSPETVRMRRQSGPDRSQALDFLHGLLGMPHHWRQSPKTRRPKAWRRCPKVFGIPAECLIFGYRRRPWRIQV